MTGDFNAIQAAGIDTRRHYGDVPPGSRFRNREPRSHTAQRESRAKPGVVIQGRDDMAYPPVSALDLHEIGPITEFYLVNDADHAINEPDIPHCPIEATDKFARQGEFR
jgi:pimeloyl-ACP methyl ester carboxylesterase